MDTTTKMFMIVAKDKETARIMSVILDFYLDKVDKKTLNNAKDIENSFVEYWKENDWIRYVAGIVTIDEYTKSEVLSMLESSFLEEMTIKVV